MYDACSLSRSLLIWFLLYFAYEDDKSFFYFLSLFRQLNRYRRLPTERAGRRDVMTSKVFFFFFWGSRFCSPRFVLQLLRSEVWRAFEPSCSEAFSSLVCETNTVESLFGTVYMAFLPLKQGEKETSKFRQGAVWWCSLLTIVFKLLNAIKSPWNTSAKRMRQGKWWRMTLLCSRSFDNFANQFIYRMA